MGLYGEVHPHVKVWGLSDIFPGRYKIEEGYKGGADFFATTGEYDYDELLAGLERVKRGEGGPRKIKRNGVYIENPNAIILGEKRRPDELFHGSFTLTLRPILGGHFVKLESTVGGNIYRTRTLWKAIKALKELKEENSNG